MKKITLILSYLLLIMVFAACGQGKYYLLKQGEVGLSTKNLFLKPAPYYTRDFQGIFKNQFNPLQDEIIYYYFALLKGRVWKTEDFETKTIWHDPTGQIYTTIKRQYSGKTLAAHGTYSGHIFRHKISTNELADNPGKWRVELYIMGELSHKEYFTILSTKRPYTAETTHNSKFPKIKISFPPDNFETVQKETPLRVEVIDDINVAGVNVTLNDKIYYETKDLLFPFQETAGKILTLDKVINLNVGSNHIKVEATDQAGNKSVKYLTIYRVEPAGEEPLRLKKPIINLTS